MREGSAEGRVFVVAASLSGTTSLWIYHSRLLQMHGGFIFGALVEASEFCFSMGVLSSVWFSSGPS